MADPPPKPLLILDLDETLIHASDRPLERAAEVRVGPYYVYRRPHLTEFIAQAVQYYRTAIWSSASGDYVAAIVARALPPAFEPAFVWSRERCTPQYDPELQETFFAKDLRKLKRLGVDLEQTLIVDDEPRKLARHYGNAIYVRPFVGAADDAELPRLGRYLASIAAKPRFRSFEKRNWRSFER